MRRVTVDALGAFSTGVLGKDRSLRDGVKCEDTPGVEAVAIGPGSKRASSLEEKEFVVAKDDISADQEEGSEPEWRSVGDLHVVEDQ